MCSSGWSNRWLSLHPHGGYTSAKLDAAAELDVPVVVVSRPAPPTGLVTTADVAGCVTWLGVRACG